MGGVTPRPIAHTYPKAALETGRPFSFAMRGVGCAPSERRPHLNITNDFFPGAIGQIIQMHGTHYAKHWGFTSYFEAKVAHQIAKFTLDK